MLAQEWKAAAADPTRIVRFKPFEKQLCPVTGREEELDPVCGLSLGGIRSKQIRGELQPCLGWGLNPLIGFETRFHSQPISNITFRVLHRGYTRGNMLVNFSEDEAWMRNLDQASGQIDFQGEVFSTRNLWRDFLQTVVSEIQPLYLPETLEEEEWFSFTGIVTVNSMHHSLRPPTAAGCVVDVINLFGKPAELPCEVPIRFQDLDYLHTTRLLSFLKMTDFEKAFTPLLEIFFNQNGIPDSLKRLLQKGVTLPHDVVADYVSRGYGLLGWLKAEQQRLGLRLHLPFLSVGA